MRRQVTTKVRNPDEHCIPVDSEPDDSCVQYIAAAAGSPPFYIDFRIITKKGCKYLIDKCVCCGAYVPEGRQVCLNCEREANKSKNTINAKPRTQNRSFISILRGVIYGV